MRLRHPVADPRRFHASAQGEPRHLLDRPKALRAAEVCASILGARVGDQDVRHGRIRDAGEIRWLALAVADRAELGVQRALKGVGDGVTGRFVQASACSRAARAASNKPI